MDFKVFSKKDLPILTVGPIIYDLFSEIVLIFPAKELVMLNVFGIILCIYEIFPL